MNTMRNAMLASALLGAAVITVPTLSMAAEHATPGPDWVPLAALHLDAMRGGYAAPSGLMLSFGIERVAYVNGALVASTRIDIPDVARMSAEDARALSQLGGTTLVQVGSGNSFQPNGMAGLVIQNTLDDQRIAAMTTLDVSVDTLGMFQAGNFAGALQGAIAGSSTNP